MTTRAPHSPTDAGVPGLAVRVVSVTDKPAGTLKAVIDSHQMRFTADLCETDGSDAAVATLELGELDSGAVVFFHIYPDATLGELEYYGKDFLIEDIFTAPTDAEQHAATAAVQALWAMPGVVRTVMRSAARAQRQLAHERAAIRDAEVAQAHAQWLRHQEWATEAHKRVELTERWVRATDENLPDEVSKVALRLAAAGFPGTPDQLLAAAHALLD